MPPTADSPRIGRPPRTSRAEILAAARRLIERDGWQHLTMRKLAVETGTAATTLYHHVRDKQDLMVQVLDHYAEQVPHPPLPADPRERILVGATTMHDAIAAFPWVAEVLLTEDAVSESALWMVEVILAGALDCGCTERQAVQLYRAVWYYTAGEILARSGSTRTSSIVDGESLRDGVFARLDADRLPTLAALGGRWAEFAAEDGYGDGLRALVDGLLAGFRG